jgi:hypothetical protein
VKRFFKSKRTISALADSEVVWKRKKLGFNIVALSSLLHR